ncbi:MAG: BACON domain-containing protein [Bacteroidales bacterium]|nr:BACON domain-containing protein [Bacteroidales bacterium]
MKLDKAEKISAPADGSSVNLKVTANVSWTVTVSDEEVATVSPASKEITDKKTAETSVTVTISENETTEARTATLTFKAEGCKDIVVEIEQAAAVILDVFEVTDEEGNPIGADPIELPNLGGTSMFYVNSNINWTATSSDATWLTATPASFNAESREPEPTAVSIKATVNTDAARSATITFSAAGQQDVVITINQAVAPTLAISVDNITYQSADITFTSSSTDLYYFHAVWPKQMYDEAIQQGYTGEDLVYSKLYEIAQDSGYPIAIVLSILGETKTATINYTLTEDTEFVALACFFNADAEPVSEAVVSDTFKTEKKPATDPAYAAHIGKYSFNCYSYFDKEAKEGIMEISEGIVNSTYHITFADGLFTPFDPKYPEYVDYFECPWTKDGDTMKLISGSKGSEGETWGSEGQAASWGICLLCEKFYLTEEGDIETIPEITLQFDEGGDLSAIDPVPGDDAMLCINSHWYSSKDPEAEKYYCAVLMFEDGVYFWKESDPAPTVKKNAVKHSLLELPAIIKNKHQKKSIQYMNVERALKSKASKQSSLKNQILPAKNHFEK